MHVNKFKARIVELGMQTNEVARAAGMNPATLYRRLNDGGGAFTVANINSFAETLDLDHAAICAIFFPDACNKSIAS